MYKNNPLKSLYRRITLYKYFNSNCIYTNIKDFDILNYKEIIFDFSNEEYVHLGDFLFIIPLLKFFQKRNNCVLIIKQNHFSLIKKIAPELVQLKKKNIKIKKNSLLVTNAYMLNDYKKNHCIGLGLPSKEIRMPFPKYLLLQICKFMKIKFNFKEYNKIIKNMRTNATKNFQIINEQNKFFIVSPFIGSGGFRDIMKIKQKKLLKIKNEYENKGYKSILIGSKKDYISKRFGYDFRGNDLIKIMNIINSKNVKFGIGFDNFWMHYFDLIDKRYFTLFRGRFFKKISQIHYNSVNLSFARNRYRKVYIR